MTLFGIRLPLMSSLIIWAVLWEIVGQLDLTFFVPPFSSVVMTLFKLLPTPAFLNALGTTAYAFCAYVAFAIVIGIPADPDGQNRLVDEMLLPGSISFCRLP
jgi:NitT/TauT family transport system permease protein